MVTIDGDDPLRVFQIKCGNIGTADERRIWKIALRVCLFVVAFEMFSFRFWLLLVMVRYK